MKDKLLFYPDNTKDGAKVFSYCQWLGIENITDPTKDGIIAVFFNHPNPECIYPKDETIIELSKKYKVYNLNCNNTRKSHVAKIHKKVFGYNADIENNYRGRVFRKSELQYQRDEEILPAIGTNPDYYYMKYIDTFEKGMGYVHHRVPYFDGEIPIVIKVGKRHPYKRKRSTNKHQIGKPGEFFKQYELRLIKKFCKKIGLDYGELDVLRDIKTKKIFVVDVNDKPGFGILGSNQIKGILTEAFNNMIQ